jgi:hypothetical protein
MKHPTRARLVQSLCMLTILAVAPAAKADPTSLEEAVVRVFGSLAWSALGAPNLGGEVEALLPLPRQAGEHGGLLLTLSGADGDPGRLSALVYTGARWALSDATTRPMSARSEVRWGPPVWLGGRRVLVVEGTRGAPFGDESTPARAGCPDCGAWRTFFVAQPDGRLREVGSLASDDPDAAMRADGRCVRLGRGAPRCWDPARQSLR